MTISEKLKGSQEQLESMIRLRRSQPVHYHRFYNHQILLAEREIQSLMYGQYWVKPLGW